VSICSDILIKDELIELYLFSEVHAEKQAAKRTAIAVFIIE
jgi:hypothetical protein